MFDVTSLFRPRSDWCVVFGGRTKKRPKRKLYSCFSTLQTFMYVWDILLTSFVSRRIFCPKPYLSCSHLLVSIWDNRLKWQTVNKFYNSLCCSRFILDNIVFILFRNFNDASLVAQSVMPIDKFIFQQNRQKLPDTIETIPHLLQNYKRYHLC